MKTFLYMLCCSLLLMAATCGQEDHMIIIDTLDVTNITDTSASTGGNIFDDGGAPITARGVVWAEAAGATIESHLGMTTDGSGIGEFISLMTDLEPATRYYVRAWATNENGTTYSKQTMTFITLDPISSN